MLKHCSLLLIVSTIVVVWMALHAVLISRLPLGVCMAPFIECVRALLRRLAVLLVEVILVLANLFKVLTRDTAIPLDLIASEEDYTARVVLARRRRLLLLVSVVLCNASHAVASACWGLQGVLC